jgi:hypothetical protein
VGVRAAVICVTCDMRAPEIGDGGHLGYPSLDDRAIYGELASFENIYQGFAAFGYHPYELEAIRAFLVEHAPHDVGLFLDGVEYTGLLPAPTVTPLKTFEFADDGRFIRAVFELACKRCRKTFSTDVGRVRPLEPRKVTKEDIEEFYDRVLDSDPMNFHRLVGLFNPDGPEAERLSDFLRRHRKHSLTARTVGEEE